MPEEIIELLPENERIRLTKANHILWDVATKEIIHEVVDAGPRCVTECWRAGIAGFEAVQKSDVELYVQNENIKREVRQIAANQI